MAIQERHRFQRLAALELPKDALEYRTEPFRRDRVQYLAHVGVARNPRNPVDGVQIALTRSLSKARSEGAFRENIANAAISASVKAISVSLGR